MKYLYIIEAGEHNFSASVPDLPGVGATDATKEGLHRRISEAVAFHLHAMDRDGDPIPKPFAEAKDVGLEPEEEVAWVSAAPMNPVSLALRKQATLKGLSQTEIGKRLGKSQAAVARQMSPFYYGHSLQSLRELAAVLGAEIKVELEPLDKAA